VQGVHRAVTGIGAKRRWKLRESRGGARVSEIRPGAARVTRIAAIDSPL
jgi:hypothetical protein